MVRNRKKLIVEGVGKANILVKSLEYKSNPDKKMGILYILSTPRNTVKREIHCGIELSFETEDISLSIV